MKSGALFNTYQDMGEIFRYPTPPTPLTFTGERLTSDYGGQTQIEHLHRYLLAREWCRGKDVLDVASGEGYGAALLAQVARSTVGVELAADAVAHAATAYVAENLRFAVGDARALPNPDQSFDVVVSFETIEHFAEHVGFLKEVRRVLRPGGLLIVSTPDRDNYSPAEAPANPFHIKEMSGAEFEALLRSHFGAVSTFLQRPMFGSVLMPTHASATSSVCFERRGEYHFEGSVGLARPQYVVAFASDSGVPELPSSVYIDTGRLGMLRPADAEERYRSLENTLQNQCAQTLAAASEKQRLEDKLARVARAAEEANAKLSACRAEFGAAQREVKELQGQAKGLVASNEMAERACAAMKSELALLLQDNSAIRPELARKLDENHAALEPFARSANVTKPARTPDFLRRFERSIRVAIRSRSNRA